MEESQTKKLYRMAPILAFVVSYFFFHVFDWMEVTQIIFATWISAFTFIFLAADLKMEHKGKANFSRLNFYSGLLTLFMIIIFVQGFLHWNKYGSLSFRMIFLVVLLLIFFFVIFKGMRVLLELKDKAEARKN